VTGSTTLTVRYGYNAAGQLASITTPGNNVITYGYLNNQVVSVTVNGTPLLSNAKYFPFGGVASWTWGNGQGYQRSFDQVGRIQSVTIAGKARSYGFDPASRITSLTDTQGTTSTPTTIGYDNLDRLTSAQGNVPGGFDLGYGYDLIGNRTGETKTSGSTPQSRAYTYDIASNRLTALSNPAISYGHDAMGNTTADGAATYTYSGRNRLVTVTQGSSTIASYEYNALGQRVAKTTSATTLFAYDEAGHLLGEYDNTAAMNQETVWLSDTPIATLRKAGTSTAIHYVWADHLDTPRAITTSDAAQTLEWSWDSDPFGTSAPQEIVLSYNLRFPGQYFDSETGKHYNYFRDYDASLGRYIQSDPIGLKGGINTYGYVAASPLKSIDPRGLAIRICTRAAQGMPGNHRYIWDTRGLGSACGMEQFFGMGDNPRKQEKGPYGGDTCGDPIPGSDGMEDKIMSCCEKANKTQPWIPFFNDCYTVAGRCIGKYLPAAGDNGPGRFNTKCPSCWKPQPQPLDGPSGG
jgi:RHS repeat-associated protein